MGCCESCCKEDAQEGLPYSPLRLREELSSSKQKESEKNRKGISVNRETLPSIVSELNTIQQARLHRSHPLGNGLTSPSETTNFTSTEQKHGVIGASSFDVQNQIDFMECYDLWTEVQQYIQPSTRERLLHVSKETNSYVVQSIIDEFCDEIYLERFVLENNSILDPRTAATSSSGGQLSPAVSIGPANSGNSNSTSFFIAVIPSLPPRSFDDFDSFCQVCSANELLATILRRFDNALHFAVPLPLVPYLLRSSECKDGQRTDTQLPMDLHYYARDLSEVHRQALYHRFAYRELFSVSNLSNEEFMQSIASVLSSYSLSEDVNDLTSQKIGNQEVRVEDDGKREKLSSGGQLHAPRAASAEEATKATALTVRPSITTCLFRGVDDFRQRSVELAPVSWVVFDSQLRTKSFLENCHDFTKKLDVLMLDHAAGGIPIACNVEELGIINLANVKCRLGFAVPLGKTLPKLLKSLRISGFQKMEELTGNQRQSLGLSTVEHFYMDGAINLKSIEGSFLENCKSLETVEMKDLRSITEIGPKFLKGCKKLTTIRLQGIRLLKTISSYFCFSTGLVVLNLTEHLPVEAIQSDFLGNCTHLQYLNLSGLSEVQTIGSGFLSKCSQLVKVDISTLKQVSFIGNNCFRKLTLLADIHIPFSQLKAFPDDFFYAGYGLSSLDLKPCQSVQEIGNRFFNNCNSLPVIDISFMTKLNSIGKHFVSHGTNVVHAMLEYLGIVKSVGEDFFYKCTSLQTISFTGTQISTIRKNFLAYCSALKAVDLSCLSDVNLLPTNFLAHCSTLQNVSLKHFSSVRTIENGVLRGCTALISVDFGDIRHRSQSMCQVKKIGSDFLRDCTSLLQLDINVFFRVDKLGGPLCLNCTALQTCIVNGSNYFLFRKTNPTSVLPDVQEKLFGKPLPNPNLTLSLGEALYRMNPKKLYVPHAQRAKVEEGEMKKKKSDVHSPASPKSASLEFTKKPPLEADLMDSKKEGVAEGKQKVLEDFLAGSTPPTKKE